MVTSRKAPLVVWATLLLVGVPLLLIALGITALVVRNNSLRRRPGNVPVRLRMGKGGRWHAGHAVWVHDVFAFRGSPAGWKEALVWAAGVSSRPATAAERKKLHRIGDDPVVVTLALHPRGAIQVAARREHAGVLVAPFVDQITPPRSAAVR